VSTRQFQLELAAGRSVKTMRALFLLLAVVFSSPHATGRAVPAEELDVAGVFIASSGSWASSNGPGRRVVLRYQSSAEPVVDVRVLLRGAPCGHPDGAWKLRLLVDGHAAGEPCLSCDCRFSAAASPGAHTLTARVEDGQYAVIAQRQVLLRLVRDGVQGCPASDFEPDEAPRAAARLREYTELHRRIVDPKDTSVPKRFLVVRSSHGLSNTQIEEVTGLLMAMVTGRALILDFSNDTYTGQRPVLEYDWPLDIWMEAMSSFIPDGADVEEMPRIPNEEYGKYGEVLACADWNDALPSQFYLANTLFGFPTVGACLGFRV